MKKDLTLVILAAGMGSRFGGLKQIEPVGPNGEFIIDYSIWDAIDAGFKKVVFVIKRENYDVFRNTIGKRIEDKVEVSYAFQELSNIPDGYKLPVDRVKPLGTAHAVLSAKDYVDGDFAIINADDFYGKDAFYTLSEFFNKEKDKEKEHFGLVGYKILNTMTENGSVKRGLCEVKDNYLVKLIESKIEKINDKIIATPLNGGESFEVSESNLTSMNMIGFTKNMMKYIEDNFKSFLDNNKDNLLTCEYLIPDVIYKLIKENKADVEVLKTNAKWYGVTYKEDKESVVSAIKEMVDKGIYKDNLWQ